MTTIRFSASGYSPATTGSFTVSLGGTPSVGDQIVVWVGADNEIVTHQPNYNTTTQWYKATSTRGRNTSTLTSYQHTWNASDSGSSATFKVSPAPSLGIGDKALSSSNILWVAVVLAGPVGASESAPAGSYDVAPTLTLGPLKAAHSSALVASYAQGATSFSISDATATLVQSVQDGNGALSLWLTASPAAGYAPTITAQTFNNVTSNINVNGTSTWQPVHGGTFASVASPTYGSLATSGLLTPDGVSSQCFEESSHSTVQPSTNYTVTAQVYSQSGHTVGVSINWYQPNGSYISTTSGGQQAVGTATWTNITASGNSPSNAGMGSAIVVIGNTPPANALVNFDQAYLYQTSSPTVANPCEILAGVLCLNDSPTFLYVPALVYEGPIAEDALLFRYTLARAYTLLNNAGTFTQTRYTSTDQLNAATQVFTNNSPVTSTDRTNILNAGVGGEFVSA